MSEPKPPKPPADHLAKQLQASLARRRPRTWPVMATILVCILVLAGLAWWLYPRGRAAPLQIMALDGVFAAGEVPEARAQLLAPNAAEPAPSMSGFDIDFHEQPSPVPLKEKEKPRRLVVRSDENGQAAVAWPIHDAALAEFFVRYVDRGRRHVSAAERGRLFVWAKDAPVLIVDVDETLSADNLDEKAEATLSKADEEGWHIVYLAVASANAQDFRKAGGWLERQVKLPKGPNLGRVHCPGAKSVEAARRALLDRLKARFRGPMVAVVKTTPAAQTTRDAGIQTILLGAAAAPAQVLAVASWGDVPLEK